MSSNELSGVKRLASHHQRSSSTGSHGLLFGSGVSGLGIGNGPPPSAGHLHLHHHHLNHQSSGSPDFLSDEDEEISNWDVNGSGLTGQNGAPEIQGTLSKWTNYIHGWQDRYIVLKEGSLVYFKSEFETDFGCRGAISIDKGQIHSHELDELRFDVSVSDCVWYLRTKSVEDRQRWIEALEAHKRYVEANGPSPEISRGGGAASHHLVNLRRHDSALSLTSNASKGAFSHGGGHHRELKEKLSEIETFRDILCRQVDKLQSYFDACADLPKTGNFADQNVHSQPHHPMSQDALKQHGVNTFDFKGEAITFKATTAGIVATMSHCIELMAQREELLKRKCERETMARKRMEEKYSKLVDQTQTKPIEQPSMAKMVAMSGPDYEEGPNSQMGEDEFYDAVENALDKLEEEQEYRDKLKLMSNAMSHQPETISEATQHQLWSTINTVTREQLHYARLKVGQDSVWELFAEDGEMRMYKREEEVDGMVVDPLKALHQVSGVTARELCHYFFAPEFRMEWETTVEQATVLEKIAPDTLIFLQLHKRVWPAAQRDALFWSHMRQVPSHERESEFADTWIVCNQSTKHPDAPENQGGCLRVGLTVCFVCDTVIDGDRTKDNASRDHLTTKITYCSVVNPGGWAPASVLRAVYKREYPKFLKRFTQYVIDKTKTKPILW